GLLLPYTPVNSLHASHCLFERETWTDMDGNVIGRRIEWAIFNNHTAWLQPLDEMPYHHMIVWDMLENVHGNDRIVLLSDAQYRVKLPLVIRTNFSDILQLVAFRSKTDEICL